MEYKALQATGEFVRCEFSFAFYLKQALSSLFWSCTYARHLYRLCDC